MIKFNFSHADRTIPGLTRSLSQSGTGGQDLSEQRKSSLAQRTWNHPHGRLIRTQEGCKSVICISKTTETFRRR